MGLWERPLTDETAGSCTQVDTLPFVTTTRRVFWRFTPIVESSENGSSWTILFGRRRRLQDKLAKRAGQREDIRRFLVALGDWLQDAKAFRLGRAKGIGKPGKAL
jgi:hypothetical protein